MLFDHIVHVTAIGAAVFVVVWLLSAMSLVVMGLCAMAWRSRCERELYRMIEGRPRNTVWGLIAGRPGRLVERPPAVI